jgi:CRP-like cAMP-binding protein
MVMAVYKHFLKGETIITEGTLGDRTFKILSGEVVICKCGGSTQLVPIARLGEGEIFGEMYLLDNHGYRSASVIAATDVEVQVFFQEEVSEMLQPLSGNARAIIESLSRRLRSTSHEYAVLAPGKRFTFKEPPKENA